MFFQTSLTLAAAAAMVSAAPAAAPPAPAEEMKPAVILSMKHAMNVTSIKNLVAKGQARLNKINGGADIVARDGSGTVINDISSYLAPMSIGGKTWDLIVDTGCMLLLLLFFETLRLFPDERTFVFCFFGFHQLILITQLPTPGAVPSPAVRALPQERAPEAVFPSATVADPSPAASTPT